MNAPTPVGPAAGRSSSRRLMVSMFAGGIATFSELYAVQAVLPGMASSLQLTESAASLAISVATGALAVAVLPWVAVAGRVGRARAMVASTIVAAVCGLLLPAVPGFAVLLILRAVSGVALAALPALAMAHLVELAAPGKATAMGGIYIAGTTVGGLIGRLLAGSVAGLIGGSAGWRFGLLATGIAGAAMAAVFAALLPIERHAHRPDRGRIRKALADRGAIALYAQGFLLMGGFVTIYNLLSFRLLAAPYRVPASLVSLLFLTYLVGTAGSAVVGRLVGHFGRRAMLITGGGGMSAGALLMVARPLAVILVGLVIVTFCFFLAHAIAASWSGEQVPAARSQATAVYSLGYYVGSSAVGYLGAVIFTAGGWTGAAVMVALCAAAAAAIAAVWAPRPGDARTRPSR